jgi:two-component system, NtrC family, sensor histidine kinase PilS
MPDMGSYQPNHKPDKIQELSRYLLELIAIRAIVLLLGLNLADRLGILQERFGSFPFLPFFNILTVIGTLAFLMLWMWNRHRFFQLYLQIAADLVLATILVAYTGGIESAFVSLYLLIIIYCSLTLGRNGGMIGSALSTILYAGIIAANRLGFIGTGDDSSNTSLATFRISAHVLGFWAVAYLGTYLHQRLRVIEGELKEKIDSLTQLQRLNEHIVSSIRSGLITTDLKGCIAVFNTAAQELTGREAPDMLGKSVDLLVGKAFWARIIGEDLLHSAKALRHEEWIPGPNGSKRYLGFSVSPLLDQNQKLLGYIISFQDLTDIIRLEEEVRLKDRMAAIGRMAAGIAHEIRNPLTSMRGSVEILRSHANLPSKDERLLDILIRESDRLNNFVEDFLCFARPRQYAKHTIDLVPILRDSVALLRNNPEIRDTHSVRLNIEAQSVKILGSADQLNQVFWNLSQNAIRAMPNGGELMISLRKAPEGTGEICFQDNGIGMSEEEKERVFQPFHSGFKGGHGLGLSIIFQIMEEHRARISFESEKGEGTRVSLCFPLKDAAPESEGLEMAVLQGQGS